MTAQRVPSATAKTAENAYGFDLNCRTEEHKGEYGGRLHPTQTTDLGRMSYLTAPTTESRDIQATARQMEDKFVQRPTSPHSRRAAPQGTSLASYKKKTADFHKPAASKLQNL